MKHENELALGGPRNLQELIVRVEFQASASAPFRHEITPAASVPGTVPLALRVDARRCVAAFAQPVRGGT